MKGWTIKAGVAVFFAAMASVATAEPTYACTAQREGDLFLVPYDSPSDAGSYYQCRGSAWRLIGVCNPSTGCPAPPDPNGPIVEM